MTTWLLTVIPLKPRYICTLYLYNPFVWLLFNSHLQDIYCDQSMMDVNIKHFLFRDGTQVWIAPSFHNAGKTTHI